MKSRPPRECHVKSIQENARQFSLRGAHAHLYIDGVVSRAFERGVAPEEAALAVAFAAAWARRAHLKRRDQPPREAHASRAAPVAGRTSTTAAMGTDVGR